MARPEVLYGGDIVDGTTGVKKQSTIESGGGMEAQEEGGLKVEMEVVEEDKWIVVVEFASRVEGFAV